MAALLAETSCCAQCVADSDVYVCIYLCVTQQALREATRGHFVPFTGFSPHKETRGRELLRVDNDRKREDIQ